MKPANFINQLKRYEQLRLNLNQALAFCDLEVKDDGELVLGSYSERRRGFINFCIYGSSSYRYGGETINAYVTFTDDFA